MRGKMYDTLRDSLDDFILKARLKHGTKFDYSKTVYVNTRTFLTVICPKHGEITVQPYVHLRSDCKKCVIDNQRLSQEEIINRFVSVHGNRYNYDEVVYTKGNDSVRIICKEHGEFLQKPFYHMKGFGCPSCMPNDKAIKVKKTLERKGSKRRIHLSSSDWVKEAIKVHGKRYSYEKAIYCSDDRCVIITCNLHGDFEQRPSNHMCGIGCPVCGGRVKQDTDTIIQRLKEKYGDIFLYDKIDYINIETPVLLGCKAHGYFEAKLPYFLYGNSYCPECKPTRFRSLGEDLIAGMLDRYSISYKQNSNLFSRFYFDFEIKKPDNSTEYIIEYHGKQHYTYIEWFHKNKDNFIQRIRCDKEKEDWCMSNQIPMILFSYNDSFKKINDTVSKKDIKIIKDTKFIKYFNKKDRLIQINLWKNLDIIGEDEVGKYI